jgi:hypothetical protein
MAADVDVGGQTYSGDPFRPTRVVHDLPTQVERSAHISTICCSKVWKCGPQPEQPIISAFYPNVSYTNSRLHTRVAQITPSTYILLAGRDLPVGCSSRTQSPMPNQTYTSATITLPIHLARIFPTYNAGYQTSFKKHGRKINLSIFYEVYF